MYYSWLFYVYVQSLQFYCIHTQFHWSSGPPVCFMKYPGSILREYLCGTGILLLALSCYIGDPDVIDHCDLIWGRLRPKLSLGCHADNVIIPPDLTQLFCPSFTLSAVPPSGFTNRHSRLLGGSPVESLHSYIIPLVQWSTRLLPIMRDPGSIPRGVLMWNRDSPVSIVSLQIHILVVAFRLWLLLFFSVWLSLLYCHSFFLPIQLFLCSCYHFSFGALVIDLFELL
jgi:hypothetical protein